MNIYLFGDFIARKFATFLVILCGILYLGSCTDDSGDILPPDEPVKRTTIMFFPWSTNLTSDIKQNIRDFSEVIKNQGLTNERVFVCMASSASRAALIELKSTNRGCVADTLIRYNNISFTSSNNIARMLADISTASPSDSYSMIVGCHGMGWLPVKHEKIKSANKYYFNTTSDFTTRFIGGLTSDTQIEVSTLSEGIRNAGMHMEYILFDVCYMSTIEVAYDLRDITDYIIASPTEIMKYGFPYLKCAKYLLGNVDYQNVINEFYDFYSNSYGTAAVINCAEIDNLANIVREINNKGINTVDNSALQTMDGYTPPIFYDFADYYTKACTDPALGELLTAQLQKTIPFKCHTEKYYSESKGAMPISTYSGITISEPSTNRMASGYTETNWYKATH